MGRKKEKKISEKASRKNTIPKRGCGGVLTIYLLGTIFGMISMSRIHYYCDHQVSVSPSYQRYLDSLPPPETRETQHEAQPSRLARLLSTYYSQHLQSGQPRRPQTAQTQPHSDLEKIVGQYSRHKPSD